MRLSKEATLSQGEARDLAQQLGGGGRHLLFTNMANRNLVAKIAKELGINVVRSSVRNQLLDPRYTVESSNLPDKGLGNDYKHYHSVLYCLDVDRW